MAEKKSISSRVKRKWRKRDEKKYPNGGKERAARCTAVEDHRC